MSITNRTDATSREVRDEIHELRRDIQDVYALAEVILGTLSGKAEVDRCREALRAYRGTSVLTLRTDSQGGYRLYERGLTTLELVAMEGRATIAKTPGVGRSTMRALDAAFAEHGVDWHEA